MIEKHSEFSICEIVFEGILVTIFIETIQNYCSTQKKQFGKVIYFDIRYFPRILLKCFQMGVGGNFFFQGWFQHLRFFTKNLDILQYKFGAKINGTSVNRVAIYFCIRLERMYIISKRCINNANSFFNKLFKLLIFSYEFHYS